MYTYIYTNIYVMRLSNEATTATPRLYVSILFMIYKIGMHTFVHIHGTNIYVMNTTL